MSTAHVRRGASTGARPRKTAKVAVRKTIAKKLPVDQARANRIAGLVFGAFMLAIALVVIIALDIPAKAERAAGCLPVDRKPACEVGVVLKAYGR